MIKARNPTRGWRSCSGNGLYSPVRAHAAEAVYSAARAGTALAGHGPSPIGSLGCALLGSTVKRLQHPNLEEAVARRKPRHPVWTVPGAFSQQIRKKTALEVA